MAVDTNGVAEIAVTGLEWRAEVCQQVFEEAAVDCGRASWLVGLAVGKRKGKRVGFPRFKKKTRVVASFRLRNKHPKHRPPAIRVAKPTTVHHQIPGPPSNGAGPPTPADGTG